MEPLFSLLIANYNNGKYFADCWSSIQSQTYQKFEVIIVDDASTDDSISIINSIIKGDQRVRIISNEKNLGCGGTKYKCAELAKGKIAGFLDPDDALEPNAVEKMLAYHEKHPDAVFIHSNYSLVTENMVKYSVGAHAKSIPDNESYLTFGKGAVTHFSSFKLEEYRNSAKLEPTFPRAVDQDLYYVLEEMGPIVYLDQPLYLYRSTPESISLNANLFKAKYWHYKAKQRAYLRRISNNTNAKNFTKKEFQAVEQNYYFNRIKHEADSGNICKKYFFLFISWRLNPFFGLKYKLKCLIFPYFR